jgi:hypothetical protein
VRLEFGYTPYGGQLPTINAIKLRAYTNPKEAEAEPADSGKNI